jgi:hypothetical protein
MSTSEDVEAIAVEVEVEVKGKRKTEHRAPESGFISVE